MITKKEREWAFGFAVVIMILTTIPYLVAQINEGENWKFTGFLIGVEDGNSYIAKMLSGANGSWLFKTPYTTYPQTGVLAFTTYIILGKLAAGNGMHVQLLALFHGYRFIAGILCIMATYEFLAIYVHTPWTRKLGTALICTGGGLGFLTMAGLDGLWQNRLPLEFYSPETFGFLSLFSLPHLALGRACLFWGLAAVIGGNHPLRKPSFSGLYFLILVLVQPVTGVLAYALIFLVLLEIVITHYLSNLHWKLAISAAWQSKKHQIAWVVGPSLPVLLYTIIRYQTDPFLQQWEKQNIILSPPVTDYLLAFGWTIPLIVISIWYMVRKKVQWQVFLIGWLVCLPVLVYFPVNIQRRLAEGVWAAVVVLVVLACEKMVYGKKILASAAVIFSISTVMVLSGGIFTAMNPGTPIYRSAKETAAFEFLEQEASPGDIVLASYGVSNAMPAWAPVRVVSGHGPESIHGEMINNEVNAFFSGELTSSQEQKFLKIYHVRYLFWGPEEKRLGNLNPQSIDYLQPVYQDDKYAIFEVMR